MGIKHLYKWIEDVAPESIRKVKIENLFGRKVAIDASLMIYQFLASIRHMGQQLVDADGNTTSHLQGLLSRSIRFVENGIKPVFVFDGKPPEMKGGELEKRKERREKAQKELEKAIEEGNEEDIDKFSKRTVRMEPEQVEECQKLLTLLGIPFVNAPCEAEAECAALCKAGLVDAIATEDMDSLVFGTPILLRHLSYSQKGDQEIIQIDHRIMMEKCGLTNDQFIDFCILCGCDYCETIKGIGQKTAYSLIQEHKNIEGIIKHIDTKKYQIPDNWNYEQARELFKNHPVKTEFTFKWAKPDEQKLKDFLCVDKNFAESRIESACQKINKSRGKGTQIRIDSLFAAAPKTSGNASKPVKKPAKTPPKKKK